MEKLRNKYIQAIKSADDEAALEPSGWLPWVRKARSALKCVNWAKCHRKKDRVLVLH